MGLREIEWVQNQLPFGHVKFEMSLVPLIGVVKEKVGFVSMVFRREV